jgi:CRP-like cAMP-binding protein
MREDVAKLLGEVRALRNQGSYGRALALARQACDADSADADAHLQRGELARLCQLDGEAEAAFLTAADLFAGRGQSGAADAARRLARSAAEREIDLALDAALAAPAAVGAAGEHRLSDESSELAVGEFALASGSVSARDQFVEDPRLDLLDLVAGLVPVSPLLAALDSDLLRMAVEGGVAHGFAAGEEIHREGEASRSLFLLLAGKVAIERRSSTQGRDPRDEASRPGTPERLGTLRPGAFFGEAALLSGGARQGTARAIAECSVLELPADLVTELVDREPRVRELLMRTFRARLVGALLATSQLFTRFPIEHRRDLAARFRMRELGPGEVSLERGERSDGVYLVLAGELCAFGVGHDGEERELYRLGPGEVFGQESLIEGGASAERVLAVARSWVFRLPRERFGEAISTYPLLLEGLADATERRLRRS